MLTQWRFNCEDRLLTSQGSLPAGVLDVSPSRPSGGRRARRYSQGIPKLVFDHRIIAVCMIVASKKKGGGGTRQPTPTFETRRIILRKSIRATAAVVDIPTRRTKPDPDTLHTFASTTPVPDESCERGHRASLYYSACGCAG